MQSERERTEKERRKMPPPIEACRKGVGREAGNFGEKCALPVGSWNII